MRHILIVNPTAGSGYSMTVLKKLEKILQDEFHVQYHMLLTEGPGHAGVLAAKAAKEPETGIVFSVGGDGTASEVAMALAGTGVRMGIIPAGTGNDFIKSVNIPKDPEEALRFALTQEAKPTDMGRVNENTFLNVAGTGFDVTVLDYAESLKSKFRGLTPYLLGLLKAIAHYRAVALKISIDGKEEEGKYLICSIANGRYFGGGIPICPEAKTDDGKFDVVLVQDVPRWRIPFYLPGLMRGKILSFGIARHILAENIVLRGAGMRINTDGETAPKPRAEFSILKGTLMLIRS